MGIVNKEGALYFATGIDNTGLYRGKQEAIGIIKSMMSQVTSFDVFGGIGVSAGIAFAQAAKHSYEFSKEYDKNMREVLTISATVQADFEGYKQKVIDMTTEIPVAATESAKALYQIVSAGHDGAAGMKILETSAKAALGGVTDTATAADAITTILNAYKLDASEAGKVSDKLFTTVRLGKTTFGELGQSIAQVAPIAASYGVKMDQVLAAVATLTKSGTPTAQAMTQIRASIIGVSKVLGDGAFATRTYQEALLEVSQRAAGSESRLRSLVPEIEAVNGVLGMTGINAKSAAVDLEQMNNSLGATEEAYKRMAGSAEAQMQLLQNNVIAYLRPMGENIMKTVSDIAGALNEAFESGETQEALKQMGELLVTVAGAFIAYKTSIVVATAAKKIYMAVVKQAVLERKLEQAAIASGIVLENTATAGQLKNIAVRKILTTAIKAQTAAMVKNAAAMLTNPYVLAAAAITALGVAIYKLATYSTDAEKAMKRVADASKEFEKSVASEQITIDRLFGKLQAATKGTKEYDEAKKAIISKYGQYLEGLEEETKSLNNVEAAYRAISEAVKQAARDRAIEAAITKASDTYVEIEVKNLTKIKKLMEEKFGALNGTKYFEQLRKELESGKELSEEMQAIIKKFEQTMVIANPGGPVTTYQFNDVDVYISRIKKGKEVLKTEMKEIDAVLGSVAPEAPKNLDALNSELEIAQKRLEDLKRIRPGLFTKEEIEEQEKYIENLKNSIKVLEEQDARQKKENAEIEKTVKWYDEEIKKKKEAQENSKTNTEYNNYQKQIDALEKAKTAITGGTKEYKKAAEKRRKALVEMNESLKELELKNNQARIDLMKEGTEKEIAQMRHDYEVKISEIKKLAEKWATKQGGKLTTEQTIEISLAYSYAKKEKNAEESNLYLSQIEEDRKYWQQYILEYGSYEEKRLLITRQYAEKIRQEQSDAKKTILREEEKEALKELDQTMIEKSDLWIKLFSKSSDMSKRQIQEVLVKAKQLVDYLSGAAKEKPVGFTDEQLNSLQGDVEKIKALYDGINEKQEELDKRNNYPFSGIINGFKGLKKSAETYNKALGEVDENKKKALLSQAELEKQKGLNYLKEGAIEAANGIVSLTEKMKELAELTGDSKFSQFADEMNSLASNLQAAGQGAQSGGWIGAVIGGATNMIEQTFSSILQAKASEEEYLQNHEDFINALKLQDLKLKDEDYESFGAKGLQKAIDAAQKAKEAMREYEEEVTKQTIPNIEKEFKSLGAAIFAPIFGSWGFGKRISNETKTVLEAYRKGYTDLQAMTIKTKDRSGWANFWGKKDKYTALKDLAPQLWDEKGEFNVDNAKLFLETNTQINDSQRKQIQNVIDLKEQYNDLIDIVDEQIDNTFGNIATSLTDAIWEGVLNGADVWDKFEDIGLNVIQTMGKELVNSLLIGSYLDKFKEKMRNAYLLDDQKDVQKEITNILTDIKKGLPSIINSATDLTTEFLDYAKQMGWDIDRLKGEKKEETGVTGQLQAATTEGTANQLVGLWNITALDIRALKEMSAEHFNECRSHMLNVFLILEQTILIQANTLRTADNTDGLVNELKDGLKNVVNELFEIKRNTKSYNGRG